MGAAAYQSSSITLITSPYTTLILDLSASSVTERTSITATGSLGQDSSNTKYSSAEDAAYDGVGATISLTNVNSTTTSNSTLTATATPSVSYAAITATGTTNAGGTDTATLTVDGFSITNTYTITAPDLTVNSSHNANLKAADGADTYTLTAFNSGTGPTRGTVTVTDTLPSGFTATAISGSGGPARCLR